MSCWPTLPVVTLLCLSFTGCSADSARQARPPRTKSVPSAPPGPVILEELFNAPPTHANGNAPARSQVAAIATAPLPSGSGSVVDDGVTRAPANDPSAGPIPAVIGPAPEIPSQASLGNSLQTSAPSPAQPQVATQELAVPQPTATTPAADALPSNSTIGSDPGEGELRIVDRLEVNGFVTGALQVFLDGQFGAVCSKGFDSIDADVACRQMGFIGGKSIDTAIDRTVSVLEQEEQFRNVRAPMVLENLNCSGTETRLVDCPGDMDEFETIYTDYDVAGIVFAYQYYGQFNSYCDPLRGTYAYVACGMTAGPEQGDVRLVGGAVSTLGDDMSEYGRLEIFSGGGWGSVCDARLQTPPATFVDFFDARFTEAAISVACRQLGFAAGALTVLPQDTRSPEERRIPIVLPGAAGCTGSEASLLQCPGVDLVSFANQCGLRELVSITCFNDLDPGMDGSLRLMDGRSGSSFEYGRLEIFLRGFWSNICDNASFTPDSAKVACGLLGYDGGAALQFKIDRPFSQFPEEVGFESRILESQVLVANLPVGLASVDCNGTETSLMQCSSSQDDIPGCRILNQNFTDSTVLACANSNNACGREPEPSTGSVRLRGGFGSLCDDMYTGFVEVFNFGVWGAVCDYAPDEDRVAGDVVCRQLGFPHGNTIDPTKNAPDPGPEVYSDLPYGVFRDYDVYEEAEERSERFFLNGVTCRGPEDRLVDCDLGQGFQQGGADCDSPTLRLTVACRTFPIAEALENVTTPGAVEGDLRLVGQSEIRNWQMGRLEVFFEGFWRQVCAGGFDANDADVACRQLGFGSGTVASSLAEFQSPSAVLVSPEVALVFSGCTGTENRLLDCSLQDSSYELNCYDDVNPGLQLACVANPETPGVLEGSVRLVDGGGSNGDGVSAGILEVFHDGAWGTVCSDASPQYSGIAGEEILDEASAAVICRSLGFSGGIPLFVTEVPATLSLSPPWLTASGVCTGDESMFMECGPFDFGDTLLCGLPQRVVCTDEAGTGGTSSGQVRLVGGRADPEGSWEYGRVQVFQGSDYVGVANGVSFAFISSVTFGRREAQVACRSLGYGSGAVLLSGALSGLPGNDSTLYDTAAITCSGLETSLSDCTTESRASFFSDYESRSATASPVALLCTTGSGCTFEESAPTQGDVRLVDFQGVNPTTRPCDDVHFGAVEFFNVGLWGRICVDIDLDSAEATVSANVICRQLGFPFGSLIENSRSGFRLLGPTAFTSDYDEPDATVWATEVQCTGTEERLDECFFPQQFAGFTRSISFPIPPVSADAVGVQRAICATDPDLQVGVMCRRFDIEGSEVIR